MNILLNIPLLISLFYSFKIKSRNLLIILIVFSGISNDYFAAFLMFFFLGLIFLRRKKLTLKFNYEISSYIILVSIWILYSIIILIGNSNYSIKSFSELAQIILIFILSVQLFIFFNDKNSFKILLKSFILGGILISLNDILFYFSDINSYIANNYHAFIITITTFVIPCSLFNNKICSFYNI